MQLRRVSQHGESCAAEASIGKCRDWQDDDYDDPLKLFTQGHILRTERQLYSKTYIRNITRVNLHPGALLNSTTKLYVMISTVLREMLLGRGDEERAISRVCLCQCFSYGDHSPWFLMEL